MSIDFASLTATLASIKNVIDILRGAKDLLPDGEKKKAIEVGLEAAEKSQHLAETQIAQTLGFRLCKCTFPPQIMLRIRENRYGQEIVRCPGCKREDDPSAPKDSPSMQWDLRG